MSSIQRAIDLKKELDELRPLSTDDELRIMQKFRLDWNYHSNNLEGNSLTYGETKALILHGITAQGKPLKDHIEIEGHNEALLWISDIIKEDRPLTENFIRELHRLILKENYEVDAITPDGKATTKMVHVGEYKSQPNHVKTKTGEIFRFATPEETPSKMSDLINWLRAEYEKKDKQAILIAAEFHYRFICVHPFDDGNGRTARILMNFILMQYGYPPVVIKTEDKENYFAALRQADAQIISAFVEYIASNLVRSLEIMIKGAKGEDIEEPDDLDKEIALLKRTILQKPEIKVKSESTLKELFQNSIKPLAAEFLKKENVFNDLYSEHIFTVKIDGHGRKEFRDFESPQIPNQLNSETTTIIISSTFLNFKFTREDNIHHESKITFLLGQQSYIADSSSQPIANPYNNALTLEEISGLVKIQLKSHKDFIESITEDN